jgi:hypothetical protein
MQNQQLNQAMLAVKYKPMNRTALELAISTVILLVLGVFVLVGLAYMITNGFSTLKSSTEPLLDTTEGSTLRQACILACSNEDSLTYCCREYTIQDQKLKCTDSRLNLDCSLECEQVSCE